MLARNLCLSQDFNMISIGCALFAFTTPKMPLRAFLSSPKSRDCPNGSSTLGFWTFLAFPTATFDTEASFSDDFWALETHFSWKSRFPMSSIRIWTKRQQIGTIPPFTCSDDNITLSNRRWLVHWLYLCLNFTKTTCFKRRMNHLRLERYERWTEPRFPSSSRRKGTSCLGRSRSSCYLVDYDIPFWASSTLSGEHTKFTM